MGWPLPSDPDDLHSNKGGGNRHLDPLHSSQENSNTMGDSDGLPDANDISRKAAFLIILLLVMMKLIPTQGFVVVTVSEPVVGIMEGMDVNLTCAIANDQKAEARDLRVFWKQGAGYPKASFTTIWDRDAQKGNTTLQLKQVTGEDMEVYMCIVQIRRSFDYKKIKLRVVSWRLREGTISQESVSVRPTSAIQDMWDGPPLKLNCPFTLTEACKQEVKVKWWKEQQQMWERIDQGVSWWKLWDKGIGWLNISDPKQGIDEGRYLCLVTCGIDADYGIRSSIARAHLGERIKATHGIFRAVQGMAVILVCKVEKDVQFIEYGWWFGGNNIRDKEGKYRKEKRSDQTIVLIIRDVQPEDEGYYWCWISKDSWWGHSRTIVSLTRGKPRRVREINITTQNEQKQENLIVGLIRDFGTVQNVSQITACLPLPQAAGEPIQWGVVPVPMPPTIQENITVMCQVENVEKEVVEIKEGYSPLWKYSSIWDCREKGGRYEPKPGLYGGLGNYGWCFEKQEQQIKKKQLSREIRCQNMTQEQPLWDHWEAIWGPSLLEHYSYIGPVDWCVQWTGSKNQSHAEVSEINTSTREKVIAKENWNCTEVYTCDTPGDQISLVPVRVLLKWGCECRKYNHTIPGKPLMNGFYGRVSCRTTTLRSPGNLVWVMGHGQWTTHLPLDGPVTQVTLGVPTLCPLWKQSKLKASGTRKKREIDDLNLLGDEDQWHEPDSGVKFGWALESLFAPVATYRNREMLFKLLGQTERLALATRRGFKDLNLQLQATSRMTLQNRMALDMLLLKEHGVCGYLNKRIDHCCIHIPNVTVEVEKDISQLEIVESGTKEIEKEAQHNWIGALLDSMGLQVSGWVSSMLQYVLLFIIVLIVAWIAYRCVLGIITKETRRTRRLVKAIGRNHGFGVPPPKYEEVALPRRTEARRTEAEG
ncbi:uncharacterized protein LOC127060434 [Serinus canaria]|uniref:uncharacterized protein LOC127060434 n=1 Tax=Serinus canaria TaxID=9135 RepID=UPI0021CD0370|nr:uncharacterized protein LOC127060434 [Serinus canaria]